MNKVENELLKLMENELYTIADIRDVIRWSEKGLIEKHFVRLVFNRTDTKRFLTGKLWRKRIIDGEMRVR